MLKRRKPQRSGIERTPRRRYPAYLQWLRGFPCCVPGCKLGPIEAAHVRSGTDGGVGMKPSDWWSIPLCSTDHAHQHLIGEEAFEKETGIDMKALAIKFARISRIQEVREMAGKRL